MGLHNDPVPASPVSRCDNLQTQTCDVLFAPLSSAGGASLEDGWSDSEGGYFRS